MPQSNAPQKTVLTHHFQTMTPQFFKKYTNTKLDGRIKIQKSQYKKVVETHNTLKSQLQVLQHRKKQSLNNKNTDLKKG